MRNGTSIGLVLLLLILLGATTIQLLQARG